MSYNITPGAIRFNTDSMKLEYYHLGSVGFGTMATGEWVQITTDSPDIQTGGTRGLTAGGYLQQHSAKTAGVHNRQATRDEFPQEERR